MNFRIVSRWAAYVSNPPEVKKTGGWGLRKVSESTFNRALLVPFAVTLCRSRDARINQRIGSLPCPALSSMFPGRLARFAQGRALSSAGADVPNNNDRPAQARTTIGLCGWGRREVRS